MSLTRQGWLVLFLALFLTDLRAENAKTFTFKPPEIRRSQFGESLGMVNREREDFATALATYAVNRVVNDQASAESLRFARRALAVALHLSPRNKSALVANFQLGRGLLPTKQIERYSAPALSQLLVTRADILFQQKGKINRQVSRYFIDLAAVIDPRNDDAVYAYQLQLIDHGPIAWEKLMCSAKKESQD